MASRCAFRAPRCATGWPRLASGWWRSTASVATGSTSPRRTRRIQAGWSSPSRQMALRTGNRAASATVTGSVASTCSGSAGTTTGSGPPTGSGIRTPKLPRSGRRTCGPFRRSNQTRMRHLVPGRTPPGLALPRPAVSRPALSNPALSRPAVSRPVLSGLMLPGMALLRLAGLRRMRPSRRLLTLAVLCPTHRRPAVPGPRPRSRHRASLSEDPENMRSSQSVAGNCLLAHRVRVNCPELPADQWRTEAGDGYLSSRFALPRLGTALIRTTAPHQAHVPHWADSGES